MAKNDELIHRGKALKDLEGIKDVLLAQGDPFLAAIMNRAIECIRNQPAVEAMEVDKALKWLEGYTVTDVEHVYSNGSVYVPLFRVKQALEDKAYNGLLEG